MQVQLYLIMLFVNSRLFPTVDFSRGMTRKKKKLSLSLLTYLTSSSFEILISFISLKLLSDIFYIFFLLYFWYMMKNIIFFCPPTLQIETKSKPSIPFKGQQFTMFWWLHSYDEDVKLLFSLLTGFPFYLYLWISLVFPCTTTDSHTIKTHKDWHIIITLSPTQFCHSKHFCY